MCTISTCLMKMDTNSTLCLPGCATTNRNILIIGPELVCTALAFGQTILCFRSHVVAIIEDHVLCVPRFSALILICMLFSAVVFVHTCTRTSCFTSLPLDFESFSALLSR